MHTLHYIAVEEETKEEATERVRGELEDSLNAGGTWYDWFVVGGGRFTAESDEDSYADTSDHTLSYAGDTGRFVAVLEERKKIRQEAFEEILSSLDSSKMELAIKNYNEGKSLEFKERYPLFKYKQILDIILGYWTPESYYYDLVAFDHDFDGVNDRIKSNPGHQFLVPVDFHF